MALRIFNTLSGRVEEFRPLEENTVRMYSCGPTVYDFGHIGNFRTFVAVDVLRRFLRQSGFRLQHVMNVTDVDDKIIRNAAQQGVSLGEYTRKFTDAFLEDMRTLNLEQPEMMVRATEHIPEMAAFIRKLEEKGSAYRTEDGSYYFRLSSFPEYGKLSKKDLAGMADGARVDLDEYEKDSARDFALWKAAKPGEASWKTEIGTGRPGWHIECSVMAMKYLGESFDIHLGGEDLIFPHHENEIAQSESLSGKPLSHFWMHVRFLLVEGEKMSKSLGNFFTLRDLLLKGHKPSSIRYLLASVPYRSQLNFTFDGLRQAAHAVERLQNLKSRLEAAAFPPGNTPQMLEVAKATRAAMRAALEDDLNTAQFLAAIFEMVRHVNATADSGGLRQEDVPELLSVLEQFDEIFAVLGDDDAEKLQRFRDWASAEGKTIEGGAEVVITEAEVEALIASRNAARKSRDFARSDAIRQELASAGIVIEDTKDGVRWKRK